MGLRVGLSEGLGILEMVIEHDLHVMFFEAKWAKAPPGSVVVSPTKGDAWRNTAEEPIHYSIVSP